VDSRKHAEFRRHVRFFFCLDFCLDVRRLVLLFSFSEDFSVTGELSSSDAEWSATGAVDGTAGADTDDTLGTKTGGLAVFGVILLSDSAATGVLFVGGIFVTTAIFGSCPTEFSGTIAIGVIWFFSSESICLEISFSVVPPTAGVITI